MEDNIKEEDKVKEVYAEKKKYVEEKEEKEEGLEIKPYFQPIKTEIKVGWFFLIILFFIRGTIYNIMLSC